VSDLKLSVIVCSRNRRQDLESCVASILASPRTDFELVVIDQSDAADAAAAVAAHRTDVRLRYLPTTSRGLSRARNEAVATARAGVLAFTDDDCRVEPSFVSRVMEFFESRPDVAMAFGAVTAPEELHAKGHIATFSPQEQTFRGRFPSPMAPWGIGANMAFRRAAAVRVGAFDPELGAGAKIPAGEELDFTIRVLGAGLAVATTAAFEVTHLGVREHEAARHLFLGYLEGAGAAYAKNVRLGTRGASLLFVSWFLGMNQEIVRAALTRRRPLGVGMMLAGMRGGIAALRRPLDRMTQTLGKP
jgi:glycosyltransferase involved in cell wall biosynthesis